MYEDQPVGDICVLREPQADTWSVSICRGLATPTMLGRFADREKATEFALAERDRRREAEGVELTVHFPDDCPCYRNLRGT
jgi:hypothetical protein